MRATLIDLKRKVIDVRNGDEVIPIFFIAGDMARSADEMENISPMERVEAVKKLYKGVHVVFPRKPGNRIESRAYYINMEDWKEAVPLLQSVIRDATDKLRKENYRILEDYAHLDRTYKSTCKTLQTLENRWYVKTAKWFGKVFGRK